MVPYMGELDEVTVWSRTLSIEDIIILASTNTASLEPISSPSSNPTKSPVIACDENNCTDDETFTFPLNNGKVKNCAWFGPKSLFLWVILNPIGLIFAVAIINEL
jgi:hypothetical protein